MPATFGNIFVHFQAEPQRIYYLKIIYKAPTANSQMTAQNGTDLSGGAAHFTNH